MPGNSHQVATMRQLHVPRMTVSVRLLFPTYGMCQYLQPVLEDRPFMLQQTVTISNKLGLHARAAAKLVNTAGRFQSSVVLKNADKSADAKSIMGVMMLAAAQGTELELTVEGEDESEALESVVALIDNLFGEEE